MSYQPIIKGVIYCVGGSIALALPIAFYCKRQRFSTLAAIVARCLLHVPGQQGFNLFQRIGFCDVLQYML